MTADGDTAATILKILSGVQSGVDVALPDGEYTLGSGEDDDIQIIDVSLKAGHARLSIRDGKVGIAGASGQLRTGSDIVLEPGGEFQEIESLDVVSAGATRFALGRRTANWASITEADADSIAFAPGSRKTAAKAPSVAARPSRRYWLAALPAAIVFLLLAGYGIAAFLGDRHGASAEQTALTDLEMVQSALQRFDFASRLDVRQELDGAVFVTGYVDTPVERRAAHGAIRDTGVPARIRIAVTQLVRNEVANLIEMEGLKVDFTLSDRGDLVLTGVILDAERANALVAAVGEQVAGLASVTSEIRTARTLLADAQALSQRARTHPLLLLRLDGNLIEASGIMPADKIDSWVGFLQAYSSQLAGIIPLRSFVQLQNPDGSVSPAPTDMSGGLFLGEGASDFDTPLDVDRLLAGSFDLSDVFIGAEAAERREQGGVMVRDGRRAVPETARDEARRAPGNLISFLATLGDEDGRPIAAGIKGGAVPQTSETGPGTPPMSPGGRAVRVIDIGMSGDVAAGDVRSQLFSSGSGASDAGAAGSRVGEAASRADGYGEAGSALGLDATAPRPASPESGAGGAGAAGSRADGSGGAGSALGLDAAAQRPGSPENGAGGVDAAGSGADGSDEAVSASNLDVMARRLMQLWMNDALDGEEGAMFRKDMEALRDHRLGRPGQLFPLEERYAPLLANAHIRSSLPGRCWSGSLLTFTNISGVVFWLDMLSVTTSLSIADFELHQQPLILEAALNPEATGKCLSAAPGSVNESVYLYEASRNADFVRFLTRDIATFPIDVAGVNMAGNRYIQTRTGQRMHEGSAPNESSRLLVIGQLGLAMETESGYAALIFGDNVNWYIR